MRSMSIPVLLAAACAVAVPAFAQSQGEMNAQADARSKAADRALNVQYQSTMAALTPATRTRLRSAQRAWISFRDLECKFQSAGVQGGSVYPMIHAQCVERLTRERTSQLMASSQCPEGDLSCPR